jgi:hypothetical protein
MTRNRDRNPETKEEHGHGEEYYAQKSRENVRQYGSLASAGYRGEKTHF